VSDTSVGSLRERCVASRKTFLFFVGIPDKARFEVCREICRLRRKSARLDRKANIFHILWTNLIGLAYSRFPGGGYCPLSPMSEGRSASWVPNELRWLLKRIRPFFRWHLASFLCITAGSVLALLTPLIIKWLIDQIIPRRQMGLLLLAVGLIFLGSLGKTALTSLGSYLMLTAAQQMGLTLRMDLLRHLDTLSADYYDDTPVGTAIYPLREPIEEISYFGSDLVPAILRTLLTTCFTLATMSALSPALTLAVVPFIPVFLIARQHFRRRLAADSDTVQRDQIAWNNFLEEHLSSVIAIQLLGQETRQERRAFRFLVWTARSRQKLFRTGIWFTLCTYLAVVLATSAVIGYGGWSVIVGTLSLGSLVAFYSFVTQLFDPLSGAAELYAKTQKTFASIRQVQVVLAARPSVGNPSATMPHGPAHPAQVDMVAVEFGYERQKGMLRIPSLRIMPGEQIAIAGENGAGKSTLAKLIPRIYDVDSGAVRIGGEDIRSVSLESLRRQVCYLSRDPVLFDGTLASNLRFVRPAVSDHELQDVVECSGLSSFVATLPDGLGQRIGPGGCQLSGGQRQRLAIARALLQKPQILILDEATSCLDPSCEALVLRSIRCRLGPSTLVVISHRFSTVSMFSRVIVLSDGRIVEDGSPDTFVSAHQSAYSTLFAAGHDTVKTDPSASLL
jgi:ABC-type multidrug transport system fused ATPase/permease subunit